MLGRRLSLRSCTRLRVTPPEDTSKQMFGPSRLAHLRDTVPVPEIDLVVERDHLERLAKASAWVALSELIWNALDAEATEVDVTISESVLAGSQAVQGVIVRDNGHGIAYQEVEETFGRLGGSWKATADRSRNDKVPLHGRAGQGRFRAFALGSAVKWSTVVAGKDHNLRTLLRIHRATPKRCLVEEPVVTNDPPGTVVTIDDPTNAANQLSNLERTRSKLTAMFALRLMAFPGLQIRVNGVTLDASSIQTNTASYELDVPEARDDSVSLDVIEWSVDVDRALHLCDDEGFSLQSIPPGIQAPTFNFTAYVKWRGFREFEDVMGLAELSTDLVPFIRTAQDTLREHFRTRAEQLDAEVIASWKANGAYPYEDNDDGLVEEAERQVFDLVALTLNAASPAFAKSDADSKKVTLRLLQEAVERSPDSVHKILLQVASLSTDRMDELAELLETTPLSKLITATKQLTDRLIFLDALEMLLFDLTDEVSERDHLHRILERELWLFGDHFDDGISEKGLTNVLRAHIGILGRDELVKEPVRLDNGKLARFDLMLSAAVAGRGARRAEHLVVELKAPHVKLGMNEVAQIEDYTTAVLEDPRFHNDETTWEFWLIGNDLDATLRRKVSENDKLPGQIGRGANYTVWVFEWSQILSDHRRRLLFMREALEHRADDDASLGYLRKTHAKYLPEGLLGVS